MAGLLYLVPIGHIILYAIDQDRLPIISERNCFSLIHMLYSLLKLSIYQIDAI